MSGSEWKKSSPAQKRWRILAEALTGGQRAISGDPSERISVRRFGSFDLLRVTRIASVPEDPDPAAWYEYSTVLENKLFTVQIRRVCRSFTANELIGFNNTGNVCVWPSEECLAYYLLRNRAVCRNRRVLELGGGMSCLAGTMVAKYCEPSRVTLTDGNPTSVNNARRIVARNGMADLVECGVVQWAKSARAIRAAGSKKRSGARQVYDVILCADCLFFDEARADLVETMYGWLANDGIVLAMAPSRGSTFREFADAAEKRGFLARRIDRYDGKIWSRHLELLDGSQEYCPDLHYPILLELTKRKRTPPG